MKLAVILIAVALLGGTLAPARADDRQLAPPWDLCGAPLTPPPAGDPARREAADTPFTITAERAVYEGSEGVHRLFGSAHMQRADQQLRAEHLRYDQRADQVRAFGAVRYDEAGMMLTGRDGEFEPGRGRGRLEDAHYRIEAGHLQGRAERIELLGPEESRFHAVTLSTCNPGEEAWRLRAAQLSVDQGTRQGVARNAWLSVHDVPVFYTPYLRFPVGRERLTGFLAPGAGRSREGGLELSLPFYWDIAPNLDSTLTPTVYTGRGLRMDAEGRYLLPSLEGEMAVGVLPDDRAFGDDRWALEQHHRLRLGEHLRGELRQRRVSDSQWPSDFSDDLGRTGESHLESRAALSWSARDWSAAIDAQAWQTVDPDIDPALRPYARQPRARLRYDPYHTPLPLRYSVEAEAVAFAHPRPALTDTGRRLDLLSRVSLPFRGLAGFVEPAVSWRQTAYDLDRPDPTADATPERGLPIYSLDAGLFFERELNWGRQPILQTLEPRLFYLNVPRREQDDLPRFDTGSALFSFPRLFSENRFTGPDRIGDADQLSLGVTTRMLAAQSAREYMSASLGQILHFRDRRVTLDDEPETGSRSDYVGELRVSPLPTLTLRLDGQLDPADSGNRSLRTGLQWRRDPQTVLAVDYRTRQVNGEVVREQVDLRLAAPLGRRWSAFAGWRRDLLGDRTQERFLGVGYDNCCYSIRAMHRASLNPGAGGSATLDQRVMLEFELRGLGGIGDRISDFAARAVPGYRPLR